MSDFELTVSDVNEINKLLGRCVPPLGDPEHKRIADLMWKMTFLGQRIEDRDRFSGLHPDALSVSPPANEPPASIIGQEFVPRTTSGISDNGPAERALAPPEPEAAPPQPEWTSLDGSLTIRFLQYINAKRAMRWHQNGGIKSWSALEWAGAMAGEAGEACNAAKKLKRIEDQIANINLEEGRSLTDEQNASAQVVDEIADTVIYGVLLAERVGLDLEEAIRMKFNRKSEEYGFPERIPPNQPPAALASPSPSEPTPALKKLLYAKLAKLQAWRDDHREHERFRAACDIAVEDLKEIIHLAASPVSCASTPEWQPIETAPKGSWLAGPDRIDDPAYVKPPRLWLLLEDGEPCVGYADMYYTKERGNGYDGGSFWVEKFSGERVQPTHWMMPLPALHPAPPEDTKDEETTTKI